MLRTLELNKMGMESLTDMEIMEVDGGQSGGPEELWVVVFGEGQGAVSGVAAAGLGGVVKK